MSNGKNKRNIASEIGQLKGRKEFETFDVVYSKLKKIKDSLKELKKVTSGSKQELLKYIPVALVGTMESFLRSTIASLINKNNNETYLLRARTLFDSNGIKFDFDTFAHLQKKEYTIGEFLSHQLSFSKYEQIHSTFTTMFGIDFIAALNSYKNPGLHTGLKNPQPEKFESLSEDIIKDVKLLFELRHIVCHEMALKIQFTEQDAFRIYSSVYSFLYQIYNYVYLIQYPDTFEDIEMLTKKAKLEFEKKEAELNDLLEKILKNPVTYLGSHVNIEHFKKSNELWYEYRENYVKTLNPDFQENYLINYYYEDLSMITDDRITDLKLDFNIEF
jgi:hypothetical protein